MRYELKIKIRIKKMEVHENAINLQKLNKKIREKMRLIATPGTYQIQPYDRSGREVGKHKHHDYNL